MATRSSVLAWRIPEMEEPDGLPSMGRTESDTTEATQQQQQQRGYTRGSVVKNPPVNAGDARDTGSIPGWGDPLEKEMATHSSILAWRIPRTEEPGGLQSIESQRI